jgi:hypothetical protein
MCSLKKYRYKGRTNSPKYSTMRNKIARWLQLTDFTANIAIFKDYCNEFCSFRKNR